MEPCNQSICCCDPCLGKVWIASDGYRVSFMQTFDGPSLANCLWSFAQLRHHPGAALLEGAAAHIYCLQVYCMAHQVT